MCGERCCNFLLFILRTRVSERRYLLQCIRASLSLPSLSRSPVMHVTVWFNVYSVTKLCSFSPNPVERFSELRKDLGYLNYITPTLASPSCPSMEGMWEETRNIFVTICLSPVTLKTAWHEKNSNIPFKGTLVSFLLNYS